MKKMPLGVPYKGSKSRICDKLVEAIPFKGVTHFYDLFCGGCAVTHKMLLLDRYTHIHCNDINSMALLLFINGIKGVYKNENRWISREDFFRLKDTDPLVSICWSFGNNQRDYLYSRVLEPYKKACHYAIVFDDFSLLCNLCPEVAEACAYALDGVKDRNERRVQFGPTIVNWLKAHGTVEMIDNNPLYSSCHVKHDTVTRPKGAIRDLQSLQSLQSLERLERLERLESKERIERLNEMQVADTERLTWSVGSYEEVKIEPNSVVYCDIPYHSTNAYNPKRNKNTFDYDTFYSWCEAQTELVLISEYWMPEDRFVEVWETSHIQSICATKTSAVTEKVFVSNHQVEKYYAMLGKKPDYSEGSLF